MTRALALTLIAVATFACSSRSLDFERMRQQQRSDPYESSPAFADNAVMRTAPAGTVVHEPAGMDVAVMTGVRGGAPLVNLPLPVTAALIEKGRHDFHTFCAVCHGEDASGRSVMSANMPDKPVPSLLTPAARSYPAGELFQIISRGKGRMPQYDWALPATDRWAVIAYVRALQRVSGQKAGEPQ